MNQLSRIPFERAVQDITDSVVLLDVDGTLLPDGSSELEAYTLEQARSLASRNRVYLVSNGSDHRRVERIAVRIGAQVAPSGVPSGKPAISAMKGIVLNGRPCVVMGDKCLTDGIFARRTGSRFVLIERKRSGQERLSVRLSYWVDSVVSWVL